MHKEKEANEQQKSEIPTAYLEKKKCFNKMKYTATHLEKKIVS